jgi:Mrp family chromosome partitioning ATPase
MKTQADWVMFDAPHINSYDDSIALAARVDGVIMVVEAEKTRWEVAEHAKQRVENSNGKILGVILNKRQSHIPDWLYKRL